MRFFPSQRMPELPFNQLDWKLRYSVGKESLSALWENLWWSGVAAGRIEGIVGTLLAVLVLAVLTLIVILAVRSAR